jgi:hypothetical protein
VALAYANKNLDHPGRKAGRKQLNSEVVFLVLKVVAKSFQGEFCSGPIELLSTFLLSQD